MTARKRRHLALAPLVAALALLLATCPLLTGQEPADDTATPAEDASASAEPDFTGQDGLPPEIRIDLNQIKEEEKRLESASLWLEQNKPKGGFFKKIGDSVKGLFSKDKTLKLTVRTVSEQPNELDSRVVTVEGIYVLRDGEGAVTAGSFEVPLTEAPSYTVHSYDREDMEGLPVQVTGTVISQSFGGEVRVTDIKPAPALTRVRLARVYELRDTNDGYRSAFTEYGAASAVDGGSTPWGGFAMARSGYIAEQRLRDAKSAIKKYQQAWDYEGRIKSSKQPGLPMPVTWLQDQDGVWFEQTLREAVGTPFDDLQKVGFWYKFVNFFVMVCGDHAGLGLILMAVVTRLLLYPLTRKQLQSSKSMQKLQPQIKALQAKHGKDKQKFQEDFWKLCRENGVNPLGGCLPLLVQMPLLWMVYKGIRAYVVQLADHSFLWVDSLADPNIFLLILYTISFIAFQKLTMKNQPVSDPQQQQQQNMMVWMMPIMFFVFFQQMASGFILYWLGTNLIYLPQQYFGTRVKKQEQEDDKEQTVTLQGKAPSGTTGGGTWLTKLKDMAGGKPQEAPDEGNKPASYEQKKRDQKQKRRSPSKRRRRR